MQEIKLVIFDIAGTVIEDAGQVPEAFTAALGHHGIEVTNDSIRKVRGASQAGSHQVTNVGDTVLDLQAGQNAGVRFNLGVLSGAHTREQLEREPHTYLLSSVAELPALWE